jgi:hypothetical protein
MCYPPNSAIIKVEFMGIEEAILDKVVGDRDPDD